MDLPPPLLAATPPFMGEAITPPGLIGDRMPLPLFMGEKVMAVAAGGTTLRTETPEGSIPAENSCRRARAVTTGDLNLNGYSINNRFILNLFKSLR